MFSDGLAGARRGHYPGSAVCHASENGATRVSRSFKYGVVPGAPQNTLAHDLGGCAFQPSSAEIAQRCCVVVDVNHVPSWTWAHLVSFLLPANVELGDTPSGSAPTKLAGGVDGRLAVSGPPQSVTLVCRGLHARSQATCDERWVGSPDSPALITSCGVRTGTGG